MNGTFEILQRARCGACGGKLDHLNMIEMRYKPQWEYPRSGNVLTGDGPCAVAVCCNRCIAKRALLPHEVIELRDGEIVYHDTEKLEQLPPAKTFLITGDRIECLVCGFTSHNPYDVTNRYCGMCHIFHERQSS